ncbi:hypothetical protein [Nonomuraea terrae]|nr:hypothetical protein [Nonomuraea terrae]
MRVLLKGGGVVAGGGERAYFLTGAASWPAKSAVTDGTGRSW